MSKQAEVPKSSPPDKLAYVDDADEGGSSDSRWALESSKTPVSPSALPRKPDGPRGVDSLRKRIAVKSMGDLPNMRSSATSALLLQQQQHYPSIRPGGEHAAYPASSSSSRGHVVDNQVTPQNQADKCSSGGSGHVTSHHHISFSLSLDNRVSEDSELEGNNSEDSNSDASDVLSECSEEASSDDEEQGGAGLLSSLRLHPAHPCALVVDKAKPDKCFSSKQLVFLPGCSTAQQLADSAAEDPRLGVPVMDFNFSVANGKVFGAAESMTVGIDLVFSEVASARVRGQPLLCVIAVVPRSEQLQSPTRQTPSDGKMMGALLGSLMRRPKKSGDKTAEEVCGWLFTCPSQAAREILELFGQNGAVRQKLEASFTLIPDAKAGSGTFGSITRATCAYKPRRDVAVKVLKNNVKESAIESEVAMLVAAQGSPLIVVFLSAFCDECPRTGSKIWSLAFEGYPGDLYDKASEGKRMMEADAMPLAQDLLMAISFLQDREIFHRDVKPENALMTHAGGLVLTDFGIATHLSKLKDSLKERGTIGYASPEMLNGTATGFEGDNFGAGVVIYFMLSRSTPFLAPTTELMVEKTYQCDVNMNYKCFDHLSQDCRNLMLGLIRYAPKDRLTMAKALENKALFRKFKTVTEPNLRSLPRNHAVRPSKPGNGGNGNGQVPSAPSIGVLPDLRRVPPKLAEKKVAAS
eukprot:TRINITY_DN32914_c0_g1_i1.p1 TRINITY_DN32914_c0_g1~~TRINITY_DN32914_c0_g1_i1.p1  ORF type:complete len:693 (+),score=117.38 TRINITY_DN32914_c0_g1_i1:103-2181(+)